VPVTASQALTAPEAARAALRRAVPVHPLAAELARLLGTANVRYCQWKGLGGEARWASGLGDLDLLIDRPSALMFGRALTVLGFKQATAPPGLEVPGVVSYLGPAPETGRLLHVHAHFQIVVGRPWARHVRIPVEQAVLASAVRGMPFRVPSPEFRLLLLVLRATLRHDPRDLLRRGDPAWLRETRGEIEVLRRRVTRAALLRTAERHLPEVDPGCLDACVATLHRGWSPARRIEARVRLERRLAAHASRPPAGTVLRRVAWAAARALEIGNGGPAKHLLAGGAVLALVGGDGSGKSTCARALEAWLAAELDVVHAHMGRPPRAPLTLAIGAGVKLAWWLAALAPRRRRDAAREHLTLLRCICTARDRHRLYRRVRRRAAAGAVVVCERYPVPENRALVGPSGAQGIATGVAGPLATFLRRIETRYYERIAAPDLVLVLRVDPETAVLRKPEEPEHYVRARARIIWNARWESGRVEVVDANQPLPAVLDALRARLWRAL